MNIQELFNLLGAGTFFIALIIIALNLFLLVKFIFLCADIEKIKNEIYKHYKEEEILNKKLYGEVINNNKLLGIIIKEKRAEREQQGQAEEGK